MTLSPNPSSEELAKELADKWYAERRYTTNARWQECKDEADRQLQSLIDAARKEGIENGIKRATGGYSWSMPMKSVRARNTAFKLYAVKFFNGKIKERREALLLQLNNEQSPTAEQPTNSGEAK